MLILETCSASSWQRKLKERSCNTSCAVLRVCKGLMFYAVVTECEGSGQRKQLRAQQSVVTSSQVPDSWVVWVSLTQFTHQMKLFLLPEQAHLTVTMQVWCKCLSLMSQIHGDSQIPNYCLQILSESSVTIFPTLILHLLLQPE